MQDEDSKWSLRKVVETKRGIFTLVFEALALVGMLPFLVSLVPENFSQLLPSTSAAPTGICMPVRSVGKVSNQL